MKIKTWLFLLFQKKKDRGVIGKNSYETKKETSISQSLPIQKLPATDKSSPLLISGNPKQVYWLWSALQED